MAFIFNANQMTPEEVKRQREIADLLARETASGASNVGQGYARIGQGILSALLRNRADSAERKGIEGVNAKFSATMDPILQRMFEGPKSQPASPGQGAKVSPTGGSPDIVAYIREAAAKRGIDPDTAVAVARSEGLNANPADGWQSNVMRNGKRENSFGPFQLYTDGGLGNEFQKATGLDPRNPDTWRQQVDFSLDAARKGGWGPWNGAKAIGLDPWAGINRGAPVPTGGQPDTIQQGGQTVPAPRSPGITIQDNRGPSVAPSQEMPPPQVPQQPDPNNPANQQQMGQVAAQAAGMSQDQIMQGAAQQIDALPMRDMLDLYSNPYLNEGQRALLDMVFKSKLDRGEWRSLGNGYIFNSMTGEAMRIGEQEGPKPTSDMQEYEFAKSQGFKGTFQDYQMGMKKAGASNVTVEGQKYGTIPPGYTLKEGPEGAQLMPIPGGPAAAEIAATKDVQTAKNNSRMTLTDTITGAAQNARNLVDGWFNTGLPGQGLSNLGNTDAAELYRQVMVLKSNATIQNLQAMRRESPTGGALGSVTDQEGAMLASAAGALDPAAGPERFKTALDNYELTLLRIVHGYDAGNAIFAKTRQQKAPVANGSRANPQPGSSSEIDDLVKKWGG